MIPRQHPLTPPAMLFASRGPQSAGPRDGLEAMTVALRLGATGISSPVWRSASGTVVLHPTGTSGTLRRRRIADLKDGDLPPETVSLVEALNEFGPTVPFLCTSHSADALSATLDAARTLLIGANVLIGSPDLQQLSALEVAGVPGVRRLHMTSPGLVGISMERHAAQLRDAAIDGIVMSQSDWDGGTVALLHRFRRVCVGHDATHPRMIERLLHIGLDGVVSEHADRLHDAVTAPTGILE